MVRKSKQQFHNHDALGTDPPPFWKQWKFFFQYLKEDKLFYQVTLLALANLLLQIPVIIISFLIAAVLFLASYKLAFEVLHSVSSGHTTYADGRSYEIDDNIGFKAMVMAIIQIVIYVFIYRRDPATGMALLLLSLVATPAYLMMLCKTQNVWAALNPMNVTTVMTRIGFEYWALLVFFIACAALNLGFRYLTAGWMPAVVGDVLAAWFLYFLLVFTFLVIGYVMYRHADELGHETVDVEVVEVMSSRQQEDPIKNRIKALIDAEEADEALAIIEQLKTEEGRTDLDALQAQAQSLQLYRQRRRPEEQFTALMAAGNHRAATALYRQYHDDGHLLKPEQPSAVLELIQYHFDKNQPKEVLLLARSFDRRYPQAHQMIVDVTFMVAKIQYQNQQIKLAMSLLKSLLKKYAQTADVSGPASYLKGIEKLHKD